MVPSVYNATILAITLVVVIFIATHENISNWLILPVMILGAAFPEHKQKRTEQ